MESSHEVPVRVSVMTFNIWGNNLWPDRSSAVSHLFQTTLPDVFMLQEVTPDILMYLDGILR